MSQYLLSVHATQETGATPPSPEEMQRAYAQVDAFNSALRDAGSWVFAGGLMPPSSAVVVRTDSGSPVHSDGPFAEGGAQLGGFWVIEARDLDDALAWGAKGSSACMNPVEVRPFQELPAD